MHDPAEHTLWESVKAFVTSLWRQLRHLIRAGNRRQVIVRDRHGSSLFTLPLTAAVVLFVAAVALRLVPLLVVAVIVALVMRVQFIIASPGRRSDDNFNH